MLSLVNARPYCLFIEVTKKRRRGDLLAAQTVCVYNKWVTKFRFQSLRITIGQYFLMDYNYTCDHHEPKKNLMINKQDNLLYILSTELRANFK